MGMSSVPLPLFVHETSSCLQFPVDGLSSKSKVAALRKCVQNHLRAIDAEEIKLVFHGQVLEDYVQTASGEFVADTTQRPTQIGEATANSDAVCERQCTVPIGDAALSLIRIQRKPPCSNFTMLADKKPGKPSGKRKKESGYEICTCHWSRADHRAESGHTKAIPLLSSGNFAGQKKGPMLHLTLPSSGDYIVWLYPQKEHDLSHLRAHNVVLLMRDAQPIRKKLWVHAEALGGSHGFYCHPCTAINGLLREMRRRCQSTDKSHDFAVVDILEYTPEGASQPLTLGSTKTAAAAKCLCDYPMIKDGACVLFKTKLSKRKSRKASPATVPKPTSHVTPLRRRKATRRSSMPTLPRIVSAGESLKGLLHREHRKARGCWSDVLPPDVWEDIRAANEFVQNSRHHNADSEGKDRSKITLELIEKESRCFDKCEDTNECCCICLDGYGEQQTIRELNCGHRFHRACVDEWLLKTPSPSCPYCKQEVGSGTMKTYYGSSLPSLHHKNCEMS